MATEADREVSRPCSCEGSCPCCRIGEVIDHFCPNCQTTFCPHCHGITNASWARAYDNVSKCHCKPEVNPHKPTKVKPKRKPTTKGEDVSIYLDIEGTQAAAFRDPLSVKHFLSRLARRQEDVISALRELNKRLSKAETVQVRFDEAIQEVRNVYEIGEGEDIEDIIVGDTDD